MESPYHAGEQKAQQLAGEERMAASNGKVIADSIPNGALKFIDKQPMFIVSSMDQSGLVWISLIAGKPGFLLTENNKEIRVAKALLVSSQQDIFFQNIQANKNVGVLFIELATRRRLRVNGAISKGEDHYIIEVAQAYPNCPKYIQRREIKVNTEPANEPFFSARGKSFTNDLLHWIGSSDTLFVGSANAQGEMDASHRGGAKGFIEVVDEHTLRIPDYAGNSMFNTLGNFMLNPKAGIMWIDFEKGQTLQASGRAEVIWQMHKEKDDTGGTGRYWLFHLDEWIVTNTLSQTAWTFLDYSPFNPS